MDVATGAVLLLIPRGDENPQNAVTSRTPERGVVVHVLGCLHTLVSVAGDVFGKLTIMVLREQLCSVAGLRSMGT